MVSKVWRFPSWSVDSKAGIREPCVTAVLGASAQREQTTADRSNQTIVKASFNLSNARTRSDYSARPELTKERSGGWSRQHFSFNPLAKAVLGDCKVVLRLEIHPDLGRGAEIAG